GFRFRSGSERNRETSKQAHLGKPESRKDLGEIWTPRWSKHGSWLRPPGVLSVYELDDLPLPFHQFFELPLDLPVEPQVGAAENQREDSAGDGDDGEFSGRDGTDAMIHLGAQIRLKFRDGMPKLPRDLSIYCWFQRADSVVEVSNFIPGYTGIGRCCDVGGQRVSVGFDSR